MIGRVEIAYSIDRIRRAEARFAHQRAVVGDLQPRLNPDYAAGASNLLRLMERKLATLRVDHRNLLAAAKRARSPSPSVH